MASIWHPFGALWVAVGYLFGAISWHLRLAWHHPSVTLYSLNLGTNLHDSFVNASWYSSELLRISGQLPGILLGIPLGFMVFDKATLYSIKALG